MTEPPIYPPMITDPPAPFPHDKTISVAQMVKAQLRHLGADGLCGEECGCAIDDLAGCEDGPPPTCVAARGWTLTEQCGPVACGEAAAGDPWFDPMIEGEARR